MPNTADYLNQLIDDRNDLADNLVTMGVAASHSETFTELVPKVLDISGGGNIGYQVTFKVEGNDYYVASCQQGESITEPPTPTGTGTFVAWQLNGIDVTFPYTPNADVELTANFVTVRTEMEITEAGTIMFHQVNGDCTKTNSGVCLLGGTIATGYAQTRFVIIASTPEAAQVTFFQAVTTGTYTYNGTTYYYSAPSAFYDSTISNVNEKAYRPTNTTDINTIMQQTLDHYFYND